MRRRSARAWLLAVLVASPNVTLAQPQSPPPKAPPIASAPPPERPAAAGGAMPSANANPSAEDLKRAKAVFEAGGRAFEQGNFTGAIEAFEQAYTLSGRPSVLFSLAQAHRKQFVDSGLPQHREAAIELYRAYLRDVTSGGRRADAIRGLEALGATAGSTAPATSSFPTAAATKKTQLMIDSPTPGALISVDGSPPRPPQLTVEVAPGRHTVKVTAPGYVEKEFAAQALAGQINPESYELEEQPAKLALELPSGATLYLNGRDMGESTQVSVPSGAHFLSITQRGHLSEARTIELSPGQTQKLAFDLKTTTQRDAAIGVMIGGAAVALTGGGLLAYAFVRQAEAIDIEEQRSAGEITAQQKIDYEAARDDRDLFRAGGVIVGGAGGLAVLIGGALFLLDNPPPKQPPLDAAPKAKGEPPSAKPPTEMEQMRLIPFLSPHGRGFQAGGAWLFKF